MHLGMNPKTVVNNQRSSVTVDVLRCLPFPPPHPQSNGSGGLRSGKTGLRRSTSTESIPRHSSLPAYGSASPSTKQHSMVYRRSISKHRSPPAGCPGGAPLCCASSLSQAETRDQVLMSRVYLYPKMYCYTQKDNTGFLYFI